MEKIKISLSEEDLERLKVYAQASRMSISAAGRQLILSSLDAAPPPARRPPPPPTKPRRMEVARCLDCSAVYTDDPGLCRACSGQLERLDIVETPEQTRQRMVAAGKKLRGLDELEAEEANGGVYPTDAD